MSEAASGHANIPAQTKETAATANLIGYSLVVLDDLGPLPPALEANLQRFVSGGKSMFVALGPASVAMATIPVEGDPIQAGASFASRASPSARRSPRLEL